jgi:phosphatidylethanolamine-binding protein (PEBP) family uncharacterized protein
MEGTMVNAAIRTFGITVIAVAALGWLGTSAAMTAPVEMGLEFEFKGSAASPEMKLSNIPDGTVELKVKMFDRDYPSANHGGGTVQYTGQSVIPRYALKNYYGPNPPSGVTHRYEITVEAIDAGGNVIGVGKATRKYPN